MSAARITERFFALYDSVLALFRRTRKGFRHGAVMQALLYHARIFGMRFHWTLAQIEQGIKTLYGRSSIWKTLHELAAAGHLSLKSDGRGYWITLGQQYLPLIGKCKNGNHLKNKEVKKKHTQPPRSQQPYLPYMSHHDGPVLRWNVGQSFEDYRRKHPDGSEEQLFELFIAENQR